MLDEVTISGLVTEQKTQLSSALIGNQPDRNPVTSVTYRCFFSSTCLQAVIWDVITWAGIRWEVVPAVQVTGATTDSQTSIQPHCSVPGFDNTLSRIWVAWTYPGSGGGWRRNQAGWIAVRQGKEFSVSLPCAAESHLLQNTGTADWTGMWNQVCTEPCTYRDAGFFHTLKGGTYELK